MYEIMKISSKWDNISKEWVTDMRITFEFGYPLLKRIYERTKDINTTTVQTFLEILSRYPDTFVSRVNGERVAKEVSRKAKTILEKGGMLTAGGRKCVSKFDVDLRRRDVNPGTTADLTASSWMLAILDGLRP
jgi:triphosphoribosyl-dephospho-CoA synthase